MEWKSSTLLMTLIRCPHPGTTKDHGKSDPISPSVTQLAHNRGKQKLMDRRKQTIEFLFEVLQ